MMNALPNMSRHRMSTIRIGDTSRPEELSAFETVDF